MSSPRVVKAVHEHEFEAAHGLPENLPSSERILWQGAPDFKTLAVQAFHIRQIAIYFVCILALRASFVWSENSRIADGFVAVLWLLPFVIFSLATLTYLAYLSASTTVYTLTNRRIVMRVGIVLTLTFNLPLKVLARADLREAEATGIGDIPLAIQKGEKIAFVHLWPHARPWRLANPEPMLRAIPNAKQVAEILADAWVQENGSQASLVRAATTSKVSMRLHHAQSA